MASLKGKVIALTGAASGIGLATAHILYARGASLAIADIKSEALETAAESIKASGSSDQKLIATVVDVTNTDQVNSWIDGTLSAFGKLDGAANIAGIEMHGVPLAETTDKDFETVMAVNTTGVFKCLRAELPRMQPGGAVVNVASVAGQMGTPDMVAYGASKHAVIGLTRTAAKEYGGQKNIRVNAVAPGVIDTPMVAALRTGRTVTTEHTCLKRDANPKEVGQLIAFLLSDESSYMTGHIANVDGGWMC